MAAREHWIPLGDRAEDTEEKEDKEEGEKRDETKGMRGKNANFWFVLFPRKWNLMGQMIVHKTGQNYEFRI